MLPFDRLIRAVDQWAARSGYEDVLVQIGGGSYVPVHAKWVRMMGPSEFTDAIANCDLVVAHLGMGSIISARQAQKPLILLPRKLALGEHTSDHQLQATEWVREFPGVWLADDTPDLHRLLDEFVRGSIFPPTDPAPPYASTELIAKVKSFIWAGLSA